MFTHQFRFETKVEKKVAKVEEGKKQRGVEQKSSAWGRVRSREHYF